MRRRRFLQAVPWLAVLFTRIVDQVPNIARVVLHGVGEPMMVRNLSRMIRYLKDRGTYVLFNTNGTLLSPRKYQELIETRCCTACVTAICARSVRSGAMRSRGCAFARWVMAGTSRCR